ncbi:DUF4832 domain-containing protein [Scytonema millei]|uniref:DUF4832 domain-containing protein n=1 Tax=Scytonema millei VB511283 TaxID=1245923 RepID=A0A9X5E347_9CYAN|nr:DUF4832 domain-containing protein [Scytonema millei]NHC34192.1 DUF4832 domain-containing protein [Scytonema millei VB511283]
MKIKNTVRSLKLSVALLASMAIAGSCTAAQAPSIVTTTYQSSSENFSNPERGFYKSIDPPYKKPDTPSPPLQISELQKVRNENMSMIRRYYLLSEFKDKPISQSYLDMISKDFETARQAGIKMIIRFTYNWLGGGDDAPRDIILSHLDQLQPILRSNSDAIAYMEAGFIGNWGEWHHSSNKLIDSHGNATEDARKVLLKILSVLPRKRMVAVRYFFHKKQVLNNINPLTLAEAFNGSERARIGHHNDAFRHDALDWGTYTGATPIDIEREKTWLNLDTQYVVQGGEPAVADSDPPEYNNCSNSLVDLARMHWSGMTVNANGTSTEPVYQKWREQGCMGEIQRRLGYRFRLIDSAIPDKVKPAGTFSMKFKITNDGWASPYNSRNLEAILRHRQTGKEYYLPIPEAIRMWMPGTTKEVNIVSGIPANIPAGEYQVLLNLPDPAPKLYKRPEYSIRFANQNVWEASTGYNSLLRSIVVDPNVGGDTYSSNQFFKSR